MTGFDFVWRVPDPHSVFGVTVDPSTKIAVRRHGNGNGLRLVLSHGNGFAIDLYYPFWSLLLEEFDVFVYDMRNHGQSAIGPLANHNVPALARDHDLVLEAIDARYGTKPTVGIFHSASALVSLMSPSSGNGLSALVLFDPPLRKPGVLREEFDEASLRAASKASRRADHFRSRADFADLLGFSPVFRGVVPGVIELAAETTLRETCRRDGYKLRCPPEYEAQIAAYGRIFASSVDLRSHSCPIKVIGSDPTLPYSYLPTFDLSDMVGVDYDFIPETTHMLQLQRPSECVAALREFLDAQGLL